ncbi:hypothetical protein NSK_002753 [Nannochloropsis salina CCMP1776]|uniref:non-specific serine/threonine protein kinase n=1 Tax=Nannochloropsis salina CCMP1776 TaxID=1027361 RepID=A0A4D9D7E2_9STRA|nr:hypothetical protein NSK_002753 [Nannochloropsis salina CCMP1776]|eukprot:TFJ85933.1 hypothetical protein NSK_002753 [Nannochloropsis salina CCMP1776]
MGVAQAKLIPPKVRRVFAPKKSKPSAPAKVAVPQPPVIQKSEKSIVDEDFEDLPANIAFNDIYELEEKLGSGTYATVYKCRRRGSQLRRAVKVLHLQKISRQERLLIEEEISILKSLNHDGIVRLHHVFRNPRRIYIVQELCAGGELFDSIVERSRYSEADAREAMRAIMEAISYAHARGVVHRDLKEPYDEKVDVWAAGAILFCLLAGYQPFEDKSMPMMLAKIKRGFYSLRHPVFRQVSDEAKDLIKHMLVVDPRRRVTARACLEHKWFALNSEKLDRELTTAQDMLKEQINSRKFRLKSVAGAIILANRLSLLRTGESLSQRKSSFGDSTASSSSLTSATTRSTASSISSSNASLDSFAQSSPANSSLLGTTPSSAHASPPLSAAPTIRTTSTPSGSPPPQSPVISATPTGSRHLHPPTRKPATPSTLVMGSTTTITTTTITKEKTTTHTTVGRLSGSPVPVSGVNQSSPILVPIAPGIEGLDDFYQEQRARRLQEAGSQPLSQTAAACAAKTVNTEKTGRQNICMKPHEDTENITQKNQSRTEQPSSPTSPCQSQEASITEKIGSESSVSSTKSTFRKCNDSNSRNEENCVFDNMSGYSNGGKQNREMSGNTSRRVSFRSLTEGRG